MESGEAVNQVSAQAPRKGFQSIPTGWGQAYPRAVVLSPDGFLVPAKTLRVLLSHGTTMPLRYVGFAMSPWLQNDQEFLVSAGGAPGAGRLVLCDAAGWGDIRRVLGRVIDGSFITVLDALPRAREVVAQDAILGVVLESGRARRTVGRFVARCFPIWSRLAALRYWFRKIQEAPLSTSEARNSIVRKYEEQVEGYSDILGSPLSPETLAAIRRYVPPGGTILVPGSGAGREALHLARAGYRVCAFDLVPGMVEASRKNAQSMGLDVEFFQADMATVDLGGREFHAAYITPLVYSFVQGRGRRVDALRRLGKHLAPGGAVIYSAHVMRSALDVARMAISWSFRRLRGDHRSDFGDWFTWFLTPQGRIGKAFSHRFFKRQITCEASAAGFRVIERLGPTLFLAREFAP